MPIVIQCRQCGQRYSVNDDAAGKSLPCQKCQALIAVPYPQPAASSPPPHDLFGLAADPTPAGQDSLSLGLPPIGAGGANSHDWMSIPLGSNAATWLAFVRSSRPQVSAWPWPTQET